MTLLTVGNSEGSRHCDARCYDAKGPDCDCCCGGANHGKGLQAAQAWAEEHGKQLLEAGARYVEVQSDLFARAGA